MHLLFWRHKERKGTIISDDCHKRLDPKHKDHFEKTDEKPNRKVIRAASGGYVVDDVDSTASFMEDFAFTNAMLQASGDAYIDSSVSSGPDIDPGHHDPEPVYHEAATPADVNVDNTPSYDPAPSVDSPSSYSSSDSTSSSDSGSGSSDSGSSGGSD